MTEPQTVPLQKPKRRKPFSDPVIKALATFTRALEAMSPQERAATLRWLVAKYLGSGARGETR